jgi:hypothetical protein
MDKFFLEDIVRMLIKIGFPIYIATLILSYRPVHNYPGKEDIILVVVMVFIRTLIDISSALVLKVIWENTVPKPIDTPGDSDSQEDVSVLMSICCVYKACLFNFEMDYGEKSTYGH